MNLSADTGRTMSKIDLGLLRRKFRGSILGVLMGDCLGSPYEGEKLTAGTRLVLQKSLDKLEGPIYKAPVMQYSDDTVMTKLLAESLTERKGLDLSDLAKRFVKGYYKEPERGYGGAVVTVFKKLRGSKFSDVLGPAQAQFDGQGSYGNGAAMRVTPIALFCHQNYEMLLDYAKQQSLITHSHKIGYDGAILQALAVQRSLQLDPEKEVGVLEFVDYLINAMNTIEKDEEGLDLVEAQPYKKQLSIVRKFLTDAEPPSRGKVIRELGNDVSGIRSVPTAIYCFLRAQKPIDDIKTDSPIRRAVQYAISLGGDTDTIASMTGAIAGACFGDAGISANILQHCEGSSEFSEMAESLYKVVTQS